MLIFPTIAFIVTIIKTVFNKKIKKIDIFIVSIYMSILGFLIAPLGDLYRHNIKYIQLKKYDIENLVLNLKESPDYILTIWSFFFGKIGIEFQYIQVIVIFFCYYSSFFILMKFTKNFSIKYSKIYFWSLFFLIEFFVIGVGIRSGFAAHLFIYSVYKYESKDIKTSLLIMLLSVFFHFYILPLVILYFILKKIPSRYLYSCLIFSLIFLFKGKEIVEIIFLKLPVFPTLKSKVNAYIYGYWARDFLKDYSFKFLISLILKNIVYIPILIYYIGIKKNYKQRNIVYIILIISNLFFSFLDAFGRYSYIARILGILYIAFEHRGNNRKIIIAIFLFSALSFFSNLYSAKVNIGASYLYKVLYKPLPLILLQDIYDERWIYENVEESGALRIGRKN